MQLRFEALEEGAKDSCEKKFHSNDADKNKLMDNQVNNFVLQCLFLVGLQDGFIVDLTKSAEWNASSSQEKRGVSGGPQRSCHRRLNNPKGGATVLVGNPENDSRNEQVYRHKKRRPRQSRQERPSMTRTKARPQMLPLRCERPQNKDMQGLTADQGDHINRPAVKCQPMTKEEFRALSYEEQTKEKKIIENSEASKVSSISQGQPPFPQPSITTPEYSWFGYAMIN